MKYCGQCKEKKSILDFNKKTEGRYQPLCRDCQKSLHKEYYQKNKIVFLEKERQRRQEWWIWWNEYKTTLKCCRCGETHSACLDFHHRDPKKKDGNLGNMVNKGCSKERILLEVAKCDVLCSNCHRKLHYAEKYGASTQL